MNHGPACGHAFPAKECQECDRLGRNNRPATHNAEVFDDLIDALVTIAHDTRESHTEATAVAALKKAGYR